MEIIDILSINPQDNITLVQQLKQQITWLIVNGKIKAGDQLPSIHAIASRLDINLQTARSAYKKLEADGLVTSRPGRGTHVLPFDLSRFSQSAASNRSHTVGVLIPSWSNPFYHAFLQGVEQIAEEDQTLLFLCNTHDDPNTIWRDYARLSAKQVDGILVASYDASEVLDPMQAGALPLVTVDWPASRGYSVQIDLVSAGYQATRHLVEHGHSRVGLITVSMEAANVNDINRGYEQALSETGQAIDGRLIARVPGFSFSNGIEGVCRLLKVEKPPTAIFCASDTLALGAMQMIKQSGLKIPSDVALASFNDIPSAVLVEPPLTTVSAPTIQMGQEAMRMLQTLIDGKKPKKDRVILPPALVIRESCGAH